MPPCILILMCLLGCRHGGQVAAAKGGENNEPDVRVRVKSAERRMIAEKVTGLGRCEAIPQRFAVLTAAAEGRVIHLLKQPGDSVEPGSAIVELDGAIAGKNLKEKEAARDSQKASLAVLESLPRSEEQNSAKLAIEQAQVAVEKARSSVDRLRPLRQRGEIAETVMYEAESTLRQATLQWRTAQSQYEVLMLRPRPQAIAEAKTRIDVAQAAVDTAKAQLEQLTIRAPIAGVLDSLTCQLGQTLPVGTAVGEVVDSRQLNAVVWLSVFDAQHVAAGQEAQIRLCDGSGQANSQIPGKVKVIGKVADPQTGNLPVRILVDNADGKLKLGQAVFATIVVREENTLAVPVEAVQGAGEEPVLNVVRNDKTVVLHPKLGLKDEHWIAVTDTDLNPDEPVIVEGGYNLPEGTEVAVEESETAKPAETPNEASKANEPAEKTAEGKESAKKSAESAP
ncbi:MAG: efflux RND transporter periplasmic adaptor subunit [Thermoguttaceae bacterium]